MKDQDKSLEQDVVGAETVVETTTAQPSQQTEGEKEAKLLDFERRRDEFIDNAKFQFLNDEQKSLALSKFFDIRGTDYLNSINIKDPDLHSQLRDKWVAKTVENISTPEKKKADGTTEIASEDGKSSGDIPLEEQSEGAIKQNKVSFDNELASLNEEAKVLDSIINTKEDWQISDQELKDFQAEYASRTSDINAANTAYETKVAKFNEEFKGDNTDWPEAKINAYNEQLSALQEEEKGFAVLNQKQEEWNKGYEAYIAKHNDRSKRINEASSAHQKKIEDFNTRVKSYNERGTKEQAAPPIDEVKQKLDIANLETQKESLQKELQAAAISNDRSSMRETLSKISDIEEKIIGYETADKLKKAEDALIDTESLHTALDKIKKATGYDTAEISMENKYSQPYMWSSQYNPKRKFTNKDGVITDKTERESEKQLREKAETDKKRIEEKYRGKEGEQVEAHARIKQAEAFIEKVDKMQEAILKSEKTAGFSFSSFFDGITNVEAEDFLTLGINEMINNFDLLKVANKAGEGKELTEEEELLLSAYGSFQEAQSNPDIPISYQVGAGLTAMAPYMAQFIITGGVGTVASKGVQLAIRKTISAGVKKGIKETVKTKSYNALAKEVLARTSGYLVGAAAQTPLFPQLYTEYGRRRIGAYDKEGNLIPGTRATKTEAAMDAFAQMYSEVASERLGEAIFSPGRKLIFGKLGKEIPFVTGKGGSKVMKEVRSAAAWDGIINEYLEEFVNIYSANLLTGDKSLSEIWDNEEQLVTLLTVGIVGSSMNVANTGLNAFANYTPKKDRLNEEHITAIDGMLSLDKTVPEIAGDVLKYVSDNNLNKKQAEGALEHTLKSMAKLAAEEQLKETPPAEKKEEAVSEDVKPKEEVKLPEGLPENFTKIEIIKETKAGNVLANITDAEGDTQAISMTKAQSDAAQKVIDEKVKPEVVEKPKVDKDKPRELLNNIAEIEVVEQLKSGKVMTRIADEEGNVQITSMTKEDAALAQEIIDERAAFIPEEPVVEKPQEEVKPDEKPTEKPKKEVAPVKEEVKPPVEAAKEEAKPKGITVIEKKDDGDTLHYGTKNNVTVLSVKGLSDSDIKDELSLEKDKLSKAEKEIPQLEEFLRTHSIGEDYKAADRALKDNKKIIESAKVTIPWLEQKLKEKTAPQDKLETLKKEYDNKPVDELVALKKKLYPTPDIESAMTPEEKLLTQVIADKFSQANADVVAKRKEKEPKVVNLDKKKRKTGLTGKRLAASKLDVTGDPYDIALMYFVNGGKISKRALEDVFNKFNPKAISKEGGKRWSYRDYQNGLSTGQIAEKLAGQWSHIESDDAVWKTHIENIISSYHSPITMAKAILAKYNVKQPESQEDIDRELANLEYQDEKDLKEEEWAELEQHGQQLSDLYDMLIADENWPEGVDIDFDKLSEAQLAELLLMPEKVGAFDIPIEDIIKNILRYERPADSNLQRSQKDGDTSKEGKEKVEESSRQEAPKDDSPEQQKESLTGELKDLKKQLAAAESTYYKLKDKLENAPEHGGKGQADIEGVIKGGDVIDFGDSDKSAKDIVKKTKDVVDDLREQVSKIEAKLKSLDQASLDFGENKPYIAGKSDSDEVQEKKDSYKTKSGEVIPYQSALNFGAETGPDKVRGKGDTPRDTPHLRPLKEGEFATVERKYTVDKNYSFSGNNKIESHGDVAFIFRQLETASVENAFAVYVDKNGKAVIQHMSMGHFSGTVVDAKLIIDGVKRFKAAKVYFVHNHPSGNLKPSIPDRDVLRKLKAAAPHLNVEAVIININTGEYSTFDVITNSDIHPRETDQWGDKVKKKYTTLKFDKQVFKDNVKPFSKISKSQDVAAFISAQRLSVGNKGSLLVLDRGNNIKAKIELGAAPFSEAQADEIASYVIRFGGEAAILFGRYGDIIDQNVKVFKKVLADKEITLLDVIDIGSKPIIDVAGYEGYKSIADAGMLGEKKPAYPATQTDTPEFKKWFKDSQIVAKDGKPLVVYHGTDADFNVFASTNPNLTVGGKLSYFTTSTDIAEQYSGKEGSIMPVYLSIKNPKRLDYKGNGWFNIGTDAETAKKEGYDGLIVNNVAGHGDTEYIAFSPTQIKSATGNVGTFDVKNPDILQEKKPEYQMSDDEIIDNIASLAQKRDGLRRVKKLYSNARQFFQDRNLPIKEMQDAAWKTGGIKTDENQPFEKKNRSISRMQRLHELFQKDLMVPYVKAISTVQKIKGIDWNMIVEYKIAKHAPERNERLRGEKLKEWQLSHKEATEEDIEAKIFELSLRDFSGVGALDKTPKLEYSNRADELAAKIVKSFESKVPKKLIEDLWVKTKATTSFTVDQWKESGAITQERADEIKDMYNNYVPLRGWLEAAAKILKYHKRGSGDVRMPKTKGRTSLPDNPIAYIEQMAFNAIRDRVQNEVAESLLEFVMDNPNKDLYEVKEIYYIKTGEGDAADAWTMTLFRPDKKMFEEGNARTAIYAGHERLRTPAQAKQHEVIVHLKGNDIAIVMKDEMLPVAQAMNNQNSLVKIGGEDLDIESVNKFFGGTLGRITNLQKQLMTSLNITFMATNFPRDVGEAALTTLVLSGPKQTADFLAYLPIAFKTIATDIYMPKKFDPVNNIEHKRYDDFRLMGGPTGFVHHRTIEQLHKNLQKQIKNEMRGFNVNAAKARTQLENINKLFEDATRFSIYVSAIKAGKTPGEAATEAKEASVNFDTKGKSTKSFDAVIAFWNPAMQSLEKNPRLARKYPKAFASVSLAVMLVGYFMAELSRLLDDDDQDHYNINTWMRHNYLTFPKGNGEYMSIPLPQFWRGFYSWGVITSDIIHGEMTLEDGVASGLLNFIAGLSPVDLGGFYVDGEFSWAPVWPTAIKPFLELQANQNYFGGQIYREVMNKALLDSKLYKRNVNPAAKFFSESLLNTYHPFPESAIKFYENEDGEQVKVPSWTDINPSKIEHLYTGYTAGTGKAIGEIVGMVYTISNPEEKLVLEHLPLINKFIRKIPEKSWKKIGEYYDLKEEVDNNRALFREATNPKNKDKKLSDPFIYKTERKRNMESIVYGDSGVEALINDLEKDLERGDITFDEFNEQKSDIMLKAVEDYKEIK